MKLFDRYNNCRECNSESLPERVDLGRYFFINEKGDEMELTLRNIVENKQGTIVDQYILDFEDDYSHEILLDIEEKMLNDFINTFPMVQDLSSSIELTVFEEKLLNNLIHFKCMFSRPYSKLNRKIDKVNVARAKRIPPKGLQYLSSHSEDWLHRSISEFQPRRIKHEELDEYFDVFENQILFAFVERAKRKISKHKRQAEKNAKLLEDGENATNAKLYDDSENKFSLDKSIRLQKLQRLVIKQKESKEWDKNNSNPDENNDKSSEGKKMSELNRSTIDSLAEIKKTLNQINKSVIFEEVNKAQARKLKWHTTNCLSNDKHYKCLSGLWSLLFKNDDVSDSKIAEKEQAVIRSLKYYVESLIVYTLTKSLKNEYHDGYSIKGSINYWKASSEIFPSVSFEFTKHGILSIIFDDTDKIEIIPIGSQIELTDEILNILNKKANLYLVSYKDQRAIVNSDNQTASTHLDNLHPRVIYVDAYETESAERIGKQMIMPFILKWFVKRFKKQYKLDITSYNGGMNWSDCIPFFGIDYLNRLDAEHFEFSKFPDRLIDTKRAIDLITNDIKLKNKYFSHQNEKRNHQNEKRNNIEFLKNTIIKTINDNARLLCGEGNPKTKWTYGLRCFHCGKQLNRKDFLSMTDMSCQDCGCSLSIYSQKVTCLSVYPTGHEGDDNVYYGMDYVEIKLTTNE